MQSATPRACFAGYAYGGAGGDGGGGGRRVGVEGALEEDPPGPLWAWSRATHILSGNPE